MVSFVIYVNLELSLRCVLLHILFSYWVWKMFEVINFGTIEEREAMKKGKL